MKTDYRIGETFTYRLQTTEEMSASRYQDSSPPVFATPFLVGAVEAAAARLMERWLEPGEMSVGGRVDLKHTAPTPLGWEVRTEAILVQTDGKRWDFRVACFDEVEKIGEATHTRFVVRAEPFLETVAKKAARKGKAP